MNKTKVQEANISSFCREFSHYRDAILGLVDDELYRHRRYGVEFGTMLIFADEPLDIDICASMVRQTDNIYALESDLVLVVFDHVDAEGTFKAAQNFLHAYRSRNMHKTLYTVVAPIEQNETAIDIASRLFIILEYALKKSLSNCIVDIGQMRL
jgi:hypothetical protein